MYKLFVHYFHTLTQGQKENLLLLLYSCGVYDISAAALKDALFYLPKKI